MTTATRCEPLTPDVDLPVPCSDLLRQAMYIPYRDSALLGWLHRAPQSPPRDCAVVICNPLGYEYTHSHRSLRHLADRLAATGLPTLRFDYHGTGDSPGDDLDSNRVASWLDSIRAAIALVKAQTHCTHICLLGIRLGAALAAQLASEQPIDFLILWNVCNSGRRYVRELQAIAATAASNSVQTDLIDSAGFLITRDTAEQIKRIDLMKLALPPRLRVLLADRDDITENQSLYEKWRADSIAVDYTTLPGYADMLAEPQFTVVPDAAISALCTWLQQQTEVITAQTRLPTTASLCQFSQRDTAGNVVQLTEQLCHLGQARHLFGLLSWRDSPANDKPVVVLLNSGTVHHVGPNRLYVTLARSLSARGYTCFRFDLEGLGDSVQQHGGRENHPYPESAVTDTNSALNYLTNEFGCKRFVLLGLCSGAHTAFHAGIDLTQHSIVDIISINPLTYRWVEGMSLETTQHFQDVSYYKNSARNLKSWLKLLRGKVDLPYLFGVVTAQLKVRLRTQLQTLRERLFDCPSTPVAADLKQLFAQRRKLSLFIADSDPGYALLMANANYVASKALKNGDIRLQFIANGNHTFSTLPPRSALIQHIVAHIDRQFA